MAPIANCLIPRNSISSELSAPISETLSHDLGKNFLRFPSVIPFPATTSAAPQLISRRRCFTRVSHLGFPLLRLRWHHRCGATLAAGSDDGCDGGYQPRLQLAAAPPPFRLLLLICFRRGFSLDEVPNLKEKHAYSSRVGCNTLKKMEVNGLIALEDDGCCSWGRKGSPSVPFSAAASPQLLLLGRRIDGVADIRIDGEVMLQLLFNILFSMVMA